jgi:hypothetical protein
MSIEAMRYVWKHSAQKGSALVVMLAIADMADDNGDCWPGVPYLAEKCRLKDRGLQKILTKLQEVGELQILPFEGKKTSTGWTNRYRITGVSASTPLNESGVPQDTPEVSPRTPLEQEGVNTRTPPEVSPRTPDPSLETSINTDPTTDPKKDIALAGKKKGRRRAAAKASPDQPSGDETPPVQPHIALIDAYWAGLPGGKPVKEDYPKWVSVAAPLAQDKGITPEDITAFLKALYDPKTTVWDYKKWHNRPVPFTEVAALIVVWKEKQKPPAPAKVLVVPMPDYAEVMLKARQAAVERGLILPIPDEGEADVVPHES